MRVRLGGETSVAGGEDDHSTRLQDSADLLHHLPESDVESGANSP